MPIAFSIIVSKGPWLPILPSGPNAGLLGGDSAVECCEALCICGLMCVVILGAFLNPILLESLGRRIAKTIRALVQAVGGHRGECKVQ
jgi:hypothetical protein